ncbi:MAG: DUF4230 domain-containing protein [Prevotella sp.]|nr:DUF4230 domain-containing protein [Prevotella sp.]MBR6319586.1 DUF4230 domain-containing protein [Prevotella sp.]
MENNQRLTIGCGGCLVLTGIFWVVIAICGGYWAAQKVKRMLRGSLLTDRTEVYISPTHLKSIRDIGQWELLCIDDEELVDTVRRGLFSSDRLVRIYYGTLRLGVDLTQIDSTCAVVDGDRLVLTLPDVGLLDNHFIDEARTRSFHEEGQWGAAALNELYEKARQKMMDRALTSDNLDYTRQLADQHLSQIMKAMGYKEVTIMFNKEKK